MVFSWTRDQDPCEESTTTKARSYHITCRLKPLYKHFWHHVCDDFEPNLRLKVAEVFSHEGMDVGRPHGKGVLAKGGGFA